MEQGCPRTMQRNRRGACTCPKHLPKYDPSKRTCVSNVVCRSNLVNTGKRCACPKHLPKWNGSMCIDPRAQCKSNLRWTPKGCRCPPNLPKWDGKSCKAPRKRGGNVTFTIDEASCKDENGNWIQGYNNRSIFEDLKDWSQQTSKLYNKYTRFEIKTLVKYGSESWRTSNGGWDWGLNGGIIIMGNNRNLEIFLHEFAHVICTRYYDQWNALTDAGVWKGPRVTRLVKKFDGPEAVMNVDNITHFWPYGFIRSVAEPAEHHIRHAIILQGFYDDITDLLCPGKTWDPNSNSCV